MQDRPGEGPGPGQGAEPSPKGAHPAAPEPREEAERETGHGREAWRPHSIPFSGWRDIFMRAGGRIGRDLVPLVAAGIAFFGLLALFPAIAMLASLAGLIFETDIVIRQIDALDGLAPAEPLAVVREQTVALAGQAPGRATVTAVVSLALSLFWASRGIDNLVSGINMAHAEVETRNIIVRNTVSLALTAVLTALALSVLALAVAVPPAAGALGLSGWTDTIVTVGRWPVLALLSMVALGVLYRYAPARRPPRWSWATPGAITATTLWLGGSVLFSVFVRNFGSYQPTYGAIAGVVILLLYMWLTAFVVLLGALLNAEMEHQSRRDTTRGRVRPMGERDAEMADTLGRRP
ncbi:YihY/virulence factor BrkB family protein [Histidinibacterium aquaticum]|uniref:YihY/virulence factor BrkB family protein n=1 Tax=Histidinibacterium aquaticum TaxID=2613962 RepID=A0A5J5GQ44_9RHOB|nr:YihY/virulence factor BrkB family protein [Histidinibacterium aquaticum]KAA9010177.1 YihY/virulence factor BrkB family protein [Histidinibacterium aquaticum]